MKVLLTGAKGMLGTDIRKVFKDRHEIIGVDVQDFDITDIEMSMEYIKRLRPDVVIHPAAYTDVDGCEANSDTAFKVNAVGARNIAAAAAETGASMVYISTDYVYDGEKQSPYFEYDKTNPLSIYGKSKLEGENFVRSMCPKSYILRTSWLFGKNGKNFVKTMLELARTKKELAIVEDQIGAPTYTVDLAGAILNIISKPAYGTYHVTNEEHCSWYEYARQIFEIANVTGVDVRPIKTEELARPAPRPKNSVLEKFYLKLNGYDKLRPYKEAVEDYIKETER